MKNPWTLFLVMAMLSAGAEAKITIVVNHGPYPSVEAAADGEAQVNWWDDLPDDDAACTESFAARELLMFLPRCTATTAAEVAFADPGGVDAQGALIVLGTRASNPMIGELDPKQEHAAPGAAEAFRIWTAERAGQPVVVVEGHDRSGTLYGAYALLERLGMRFYGLGEQGTVDPASPSEIPRSLDISEQPDFFTRGFWAWEPRGNSDFFLWMARNRMNFWTAAEPNVHLLKKLGIKLSMGGHIIQKTFLDPDGPYPYNHPSFQGDESKPEDPYPVSPAYGGDLDGDGTLEYFEGHPDWYGLLDGKRQRKMEGDFGPVNFCTTNADAVAELSRNLIAALVDGDWRYTDILYFWMLDVSKWCTCDTCAAAGTPTDRLLQLLHAVNGHVQEARREGRLKRDIDLVSLAYAETLPPPTRPLPEGFDYRRCYLTYFPIARTYTHALADPASTEVNVYHLEQYEGWTQGQGRYYQGDICIGEYYNVSSIKTLPALYMHMMSVDIPWYYRTGALHFQYMHTPTRLWGTWTLNQYLMARLTWDTGADADGLLDEYFERYYPGSSRDTRAFYEHLEKATANIKAFKHNVRGYSLRGALSRRDKNLFPEDTLHYETFHPELNDGIDVVDMMAEMDRARACLDAALLEARDAKEKARLLEDEARFAYGEAMFKFYYHMVRITIAHNAGDTGLARREFAYVERYAKQLEAITDVCQVASTHANAPNGLEASQIVPAYEFMKAQYGPALEQ